jgi:hypothetical protein
LNWICQFLVIVETSVLCSNFIKDGARAPSGTSSTTRQPLGEACEASAQYLIMVKGKKFNETTWSERHPAFTEHRTAVILIPK